jgi:hypothetical protein
MIQVHANGARMEAAGITAGALFRRIWIPPRGRDTPLPRVGTMAIDAGTIARIIQARAALELGDPFEGHPLNGVL